MRVIDGEHRLLAAIARGHSTIAVRFFDGSAADAFALAVHANVVHGLALLTEERKAAALRLLDSHPHYSDRMIARISGLSHKTVGALRRRATGDRPHLHGRRVGIDGRVRRPGIAEGRRIARQLVEQNPKMSLRQLAAAADISTGTARDVRDRYLAEQDCDSRSDADDAGGGTSCIPADPPDRSTRTKEKRPHAVAASSSDSAYGVLLSKLRNDPALRFSEKGREFLRRLSDSVREVELIEHLLAETPQRWHSTIAELARVNAMKWGQLAARLETRH
ncbi:hypothetical protein [Nocardia sp. NPDC047648]|uniref:hypothetical protein n=1 Tax=Nocardia sp. NPDC047648 TaxID=3155625 RepID=UPI0033CBF195